VKFLIFNKEAAKEEKRLEKERLTDE